MTRFSLDNLFCSFKKQSKCIKQRFTYLYKCYSQIIFIEFIKLELKKLQPQDIYFWHHV